MQRHVGTMRAVTAAATAAVSIACRCRNDARVHGQINGGAGRKRKSAGGALARHAAPERVVAVHEHRRRGHRGQRARAGDFQIGMHAFVELHAAAVAAGCTPRNGRHALVRSEAAAAAQPAEAVAARVAHLREPGGQGGGTAKRVVISGHQWSSLVISGH